MSDNNGSNKEIEVITLDDENEQLLLDFCDELINRPSTSTFAASNATARNTSNSRDKQQKRKSSDKVNKAKNVKISKRELLKGVDFLLKRKSISDEDSVAIARALKELEDESKIQQNSVNLTYKAGVSEEDSMAIGHALQELENEFIIQKTSANISVDENDALAIAQALQDLENELHIENNSNFNMSEADSLAIAAAIQEFETNYNNVPANEVMVNVEELTNQIETLDSYNENAAEIRSLSIIHPKLEILDPNPDLYQLYKQFDKSYFDGFLSKTPLKLGWANNYFSAAGMFYSYKDGAPTIQLSANLLTLRPRRDFVETLLHEMIHAYVFLQGLRDDNDHGKVFQFHMNRINGVTGANITIYHNFHREMSYLRKFIWRCTGSKCQAVPPSRGYISLATKRKPNRWDGAFRTHQHLGCTGTFVQVSNNFDTPKSNPNKAKK